MNEQDEIASLRSEIERLQDAKRRALALADERAKEANELHAKIASARKALEAAEAWLSGWASAEPYISEIRSALKDLP